MSAQAQPLRFPGHRPLTEEEILYCFGSGKCRLETLFGNTKREVFEQTGKKIHLIRVSLYKAKGMLPAFLEWTGNPIYHTGIDYHPCSDSDWYDKTEVSFGSSNGIFKAVAGSLEDSHRTHIGFMVVGYTCKSRQELEDVIDSMRDKYAVGTYNLYSFNCHTFCNEFLDKLGCGKIPKYYTNIAERVDDFRSRCKIKLGC